MDFYHVMPVDPALFYIDGLHLIPVLCISSSSGKARTPELVASEGEQGSKGHQPWLELFMIAYSTFSSYPNFAFGRNVTNKWSKGY